MSLLNQGFPQPTVSPVAVAVAQAVGRPVTSVLGGGGGADPYAANGFEPDLVADFAGSLNSAVPFFRKQGSICTLADFEFDEPDGLRTLTNSSGELVWNAHNLLTYSEQFDNAAWNKSNASVSADATTAPDGTTTADRITATSASDPKARQLSLSAVQSGVRNTFVVFAKADAADSFRFGIFWNAGRLLYDFDLTAETATVVNDNASGSATITSVGSGWYACEMEGVRSESSPTFQVSLLADADSLFFWGAHIYRSDLGGMDDVESSYRADPALTKYLPTTTTARYLPRFNNHERNGSAWVPAGALVEREARTNLLLNTETLSTQNVTTTAQPYTLHFTGTGTVTLSGTSTAGPLVGTGTGENNRVSLTFTPTAGTLTLTVSGTVTRAMLEAAQTRSSYIPSGSAATARTGDPALTFAAADAPYSASGLSLAVIGDVTYADEGSAAQFTIANRETDASNYLSIDVDTDGAATGEVNANQAAAGTVDTATGATELSPGVAVAFGIASRHTDGAIQVATLGSAGTANTTPTALADFSSTDLDIAAVNFMGNIARVVGWGEDVGEAGIEQSSTEDNTTP